jgi:hypothetical protein
MVKTTAALFRVGPAQRAVTTALTLALAVGGASAQTADGGQPTAVVIEVENGTTRGEGRGDEVRVELLGAVRQEVASGGSFTGTTTLADVPIVPDRDYLITVRYDEVDYFLKAAGSALAREPQLVYVFDATTDRDGLAISGMDLIARHQGSTLECEYIVTVTNDGRPQRSVVPAPATLELALPAGASSVEVLDMRGAEAIPAATVAASRGRTGLVVPLAPGRNSIRLNCLVDFTDPVDLPIEANVPITEWDLLAFPASLRVDGRGLEADPSSKASDAFIRYLGRPLGANETFAVTITGGTAVQADQAAQEVFTRPAPADAEPDATAGSAGAGKARYIVPLAIVLIVAWLFMRRRRRSDPK